MGLLDDVLGGALGGMLGGSAQPPQPGQVPQQGQSSILLTLALQLLQQSGGLTGLIERFRRAGLGNQVASWVSTGENLPVSGEQVHQALGPDVLNQLAGQLGMDPAQVSHGLAQVLPNLVNQMTPDGQVPDNHHDVISDALNALLRRGPG
jgi:uncharacterized protein YidB (DUF937 family)